MQYLMLFVLLAYLTRILSPRDFGLMATLSIGLDLGLRVARWGQIELLQQPRYRTDAARNHAFWTSLKIACAPVLLFVVAAWPLGQFFQSPQLTTMAYLCAPIILISAAGSTAEAILRNEFRFEQITYRNTVCTLAGGATAIILAFQGYGALALAAQQLVQAILGTIWLWATVAWRPSWRRKPFPDAQITRDGGSIMVASLLPQLIPRLFDLFVALLLGPVALGILRVANRFADFVGQMVWLPLIGVASAQFPTHADDKEALRRAFLRFTQASALVACPLLIGVGLVAEEAVPLLFGAHWQPSVPIVQISALVALFIPVSSYFGPVMIALGQRRTLVRQSLFDVAAGLVAAVVASNISLMAVAIALVARCAFTSICNARDLRTHLGLTYGSLITYLSGPYIACLTMTACVLATRRLLPANQSDLLMLVILMSVGACAYAATLAFAASMRLWPNEGVALGGILRRAREQGRGASDPSAILPPMIT